MKKKKVLFLTLIIVLVSSSMTFADNLGSSSSNYQNIAYDVNNVEPQEYTDQVINYTKDTYVFDEWGIARRVSSETFYKTISFPNGYRLSGTREDTQGILNGYIVFTYYDYTTY